MLGTDGWDSEERGRAAEAFGYDFEESEEYHRTVFPRFEIGSLSLDQFLEQTVLFRPRSFGLADLREFVFRQSVPYPESLEVARAAAESGRYLMATANNEGRELNEFRIERFGLRQEFETFFCSCYLGLRKPDPNFYRRILEIVQREPEECLMIDDRPENLDPARELGLQSVRFRSAQQLRRELGALGILDESSA